MGKGSSSQQPTQPTSSTVTQTNLPAYVQPYFENVLQRSSAVSQQAYQPYDDQRLATFNPDQNASFQSVRDIFNAGTPGQITGATSTANAVAGLLPYNLQNTWNTPTASAYMNPYINNVLNNVTSRANQQFAMQQGERNAAAVKAGAFGGDRRFVQDSIAQDNLNRQLSEIEAQGLSQAYTQGNQMFQGDRAAQLQAQSLGLNSAYTLGGLGAQQQQLDLGRANALANIGAGERGLQQQSLDIGYQDFLNQNNYPYQQLNWMSGILHGVPTQFNTNSTQYTTPPNPANSIIGAGLATAGLGAQLGWFS